MVSVVVEAETPLLPCPFCGGVDLHIETDSEPSSFQVMCDNEACEAAGPNAAMTAEGAVALWNSR